MIDKPTATTDTIKREGLISRIAKKTESLRTILFADTTSLPGRLTEELFFTPIEQYFKNESDVSNLHYRTLYFYGQMLMIPVSEIESYRQNLPSISVLIEALQIEYGFFAKSESIAKDHYGLMVKKFQQNTVGTIFGDEDNETFQLIKDLELFLYPTSYKDSKNSIRTGTLIGKTPYRPLLGYVDPEISPAYRKLHLLFFLFWLKANN